MRFPWRRRAEAAEQARKAAERKAREAEAQWPHVRKAVEPLRIHASLNGWTDIAVSVFGGQPRKDDK